MFIERRCLTSRKKNSCRCGESEGVYKIKNIELWLCGPCRSVRRGEAKKRRQSLFSYTNRQDASEAYDRNLRFGKRGNSWPEYEILDSDFRNKGLSISAIAVKHGKGMTSVWRAWRLYYAAAGPVKITGHGRRSVSARKKNRLASRQAFGEDEKLAEFKKAARVRLVSVKPFIRCVHGQPKTHSTWRFYAGDHLCAFYRAKVHDIRGRLYAQTRGATSMLSEVEFLVVRVPGRNSEIRYLIVPVKKLRKALLLKRKNFGADIPIDGWSKRSTRKPSFDWLKYMDRFDLLQSDRIKLRVAKASLPLQKGAVHGTVA